MKRSLASTSTVKDDDDVQGALSGYHTSDETDDEGWDLGPPPCRASDVSDDEGWDLGPPVDQKPKKTARIPPPVVDDGEGGHLVTVTKDRKPCQVYASYAHADGTLRGGCHGTCRHQFVDLMTFAPGAGAARTVAKRTRFVAAYDAYKRAFARGDQYDCAIQRATLEALRTTRCSACRPDPGHMTPATRACKEWYDAKRREMCALNHGCANPECPERGPDVWYILTADHGTNPKAKHPKTGKPVSLSHVMVWPSRGGVPAMEAENEQIESWPCHVCHNLAPTSYSGKRCPDPATMPKGKSRGTELEQKQYNARHKAEIRYPKQQYVDAAKRTIGCCAACKRPVRPGTEPGFDFDHRDESTKNKGGLFGECGGVAGLVGNCAKAAALALVRELLDAEMDKCQLLCKNCHMRKTWGYEASTTEF
jgi:hypothetical protein